MKVLFICPATGFYTRVPSVPLGLLSISTYIKKEGHEVQIYDRNIKEKGIKSYIKSFKPDIVGVSVISNMAINDAIKISRIVKNYSIPVVWGGHMASLVPRQVFDTKLVDFICIGEGENTFLELLNAIQQKKPFKDIDGLAYIENKIVCINKEREFADLADLPIIDWSIIDPKKYFQPFFHCNKMLYIYSSKGCPFKCTFCSNVSFHRGSYRERPPEYFLSEIEYLIKNCSMDGVYFADDLWCLTREHMHEICNKMKERKINIIWGCQTRIGQFNREDFQIMYDSGCRWLLFGIESGSKEVLKRIKKGLDFNKIEETLSDCTEIGITTIGGLIIGFPGETEEELRETVQFALNCDINLYSINHLTYFPGSELYNEITSNGLFKAPSSLMEWSKIQFAEKTNPNLSKVPTKDLVVIRSFFLWYSFSRKDSVNREKPYAFAQKAIIDAFSNILKHGFLSFVTGLFIASKTFLGVVWNVVAYPGIRKKYGLYVKK